MKLIKKQASLIFILLLALSFLAVLPFFKDGFFAFHDDVQVSRVYEMGKGLLLGGFPVRWVPDLGYGLRYPIFNFYSVLPYYIGGALTLIGFNALIATKIVFVAAIVGSGLSMYFFAKSFFGQAAGLVAAVLYLYFPYHAVNIFVRGDLAELAAYAFLPLVFLSLYKVHQDQKFEKKYVILGSFSIAAVILSHNLTAFMSFIFSIIFISFSLIASKNKRTVFISYVLIFGLAFLLSAFYSIPASLEAKYTNIATILGGGSNPFNHFICINQLWSSPWGFGGSQVGCIDGISFKLGKLNIILGVLSSIILFVTAKKWKEIKGIIIFSIIFLFTAIFMTLSYSSFLWGFPFMEFLQFPWRFMNFIGLFLSFTVAGGVWALSYYIKKEQILILITLIIAIAIVLSNYKLFQPQKYLNRDSSYYTNQKYLTWTASKISDEYLAAGFIRPKNINEISRVKLPENDLFQLEPVSRVYSTEQTLIQKLSNSLSMIGVVVIILVIISGHSLIYGKKTS